MTTDEQRNLHIDLLADKLSEISRRIRDHERAAEELEREFAILEAQHESLLEDFIQARKARRDGAVH